MGQMRVEAAFAAIHAIEGHHPILTHLNIPLRDDLVTDKPDKTIYDLALHETMEVGKHYQDHMFATRVPGR